MWLKGCLLLKAVFHKFYLIHSWILGVIYHKAECKKRLWQTRNTNRFLLSLSISYHFLKASNRRRNHGKTLYKIFWNFLLVSIEIFLPKYGCSIKTYVGSENSNRQYRFQGMWSPQVAEHFQVPLLILYQYKYIICLFEWLHLLINFFFTSTEVWQLSAFKNWFFHLFLDKDRL